MAAICRASISIDDAEAMEGCGLMLACSKQSYERRVEIIYDGAILMSLSNVSSLIIVDMAAIWLAAAVHRRLRTASEVMTISQVDRCFTGSRPSEQLFCYAASCKAEETAE